MPQDPRTRLRSVFLLVGLSWLNACSSSTPAEPAWPEQPAPAYPAPSSSSSNSSPAPASPTERPVPSTPSENQDSALAQRYAQHPALETLRGKATYYADSLAGNRTASGEVYRPELHTAAHKKLPFGTIVRVTRTDNGLSSYVKINDRGPFGPSDRIIDVSRKAAEELQMLRAGVIEVRVEILEKPAKKK